MKKKTLIMGMILLASTITACGGNKPVSSSISTTNGLSSTEPKPTSTQLILDNTFQNGFTCEPGSGSQQDTGWIPDDRWSMNVELKYGDNDTPSSWIMAQHGDIYSLNDKYNKYVGGTPTYEDGYYTFADESKKVSVNPTKGACYLELNASKEYTRPRKGGEQWCHLLLEQGFTEAVQVKECEDIIFTIDLEMKKWEDHMDGQANRDTHACQFLMYLVIKSAAGLDANDFFWFGIPFYDNRYPHGLAETGMIDAGGAGATSKFIYGMESIEYLPDGVNLNEVEHVNFDIKPYLGRALILAQQKGFFTNSTVDDLTFQSMNIGFEIPGTYDCGIEISNFSLTANYKQ